MTAKEALQKPAPVCEEVDKMYERNIYIKIRKNEVVYSKEQQVQQDHRGQRA